MSTISSRTFRTGSTLPTPRRKNASLSNVALRKKLSQKDSRSKPFGFCCSPDRYNPLSQYDQRIPSYKSSLTAITSVHECPTVKMQFSILKPFREKKKVAKRLTDTKNLQQLSQDKKLNRNNHYVRHYLEDEIALAKDIFWAEKQRIYKEESKKAIKLAKKKNKNVLQNLKPNYPRWYQDFSLDQMRHLMNLQNAIITDYKDTKTNNTQTILIAIGIVSKFFKLKSSTIKVLHKSCNLNSINFLQETYRILTGNYFCKERYKKAYDCNERIILSAIALLTLPETTRELHKRLPAVTIPKLPPKPKLTWKARRKNSCPYKEELFIRPDWAGYRNAVQKWRRKRKLIAIPKINFKSEKQKNISIEYLEQFNMKKLQRISSNMYDQECKQVIDKTEEKINANQINVNDKEYVNKSDPATIMKIELKKMAAEGYTFAKLPKCYLMPQFQDWIKHRKGVVFSEMDKENLMKANRAVWNKIIVHKSANVTKPSLHMTKSELRKLTYDQADRIRRKIKKIKEAFYSEVRKARVSYTRMMWSTMEHGKFPSSSFKRAFFTYMFSKEADGYVYKPWMTSEINEQKFDCCY